MRRNDENIRVPIPLPIKGVNRAFARDSQPEGTAWDALNVFPFDRQGRTRLSTRGGLGFRKDLETSARVRLLQSASIPGVPPGLGGEFGNGTEGQAYDFTIDTLGDADVTITDATTLRWGGVVSGSPIDQATLDAMVAGVYADNSTVVVSAADILAIETVSSNTGLVSSPTGSGGLPGTPTYYFAWLVPDNTLNTDLNGAPADEAFSIDMPFQLSASASGSLDHWTGLAAGIDADWIANTDVGDPFAVAVRHVSTNNYRLYVDLARSTVAGTTPNFADEDTDEDQIINFTSGVGTPTATQTLILTLNVSRTGVWQVLFDSGSGPAVIASGDGLFHGATRSWADFLAGYSAVGGSGRHDQDAVESTLIERQVHNTEGFTSYAAINYRQILVAASGPATFIGPRPGQLEPVSNWASFMLATDKQLLAAATLFGYMYIVDGSDTIFKLNLNTELFETYTASAGTAPEGATMAVNYRGRLILAGFEDDPQNFIASKSGDPTNWDFAGTDSTTAFAGNASLTGLIAHPITALIAMSEDLLIIGAEQNIYCMRGDIADGGSIDLVTDAAGIVGQNAWCRAPDGSMYFISPTGLHKMNPDGTGVVPVGFSQYPQFFQELDRATNYISLIYDNERHGVFIFATPTQQSLAPTAHLFYHEPLQGFWPIEFTNVPQAGPVVSMYWDSTGTDNRYPLLGGYGGLVFSMNFTNKNDHDELAAFNLIPAYVVLGPLALSTIEDGVLSRLDITGGEPAGADTDTDYTLEWTIKAGSDAFDVTEGTPALTTSGTFSASGRAQTEYPRTRGGWFSLRIGNETEQGDYFVLENVVVHFIPAGSTRV